MSVLNVRYCRGLAHFGYWVALIALLGVLAPACKQESSRSKTPPPAPAPPAAPEAAAPPPPSGPTLTAAQYDQLRIGMPYEGVVKILGFQGQFISRQKTEGIPGVMEPVETVKYVWKSGEDGILLTFENNRLKEKMQFGLK